MSQQGFSEVCIIYDDQMAMALYFRTLSLCSFILIHSTELHDIIWFDVLIITYSVTYVMSAVSYFCHGQKLAIFWNTWYFN